MLIFSSVQSDTYDILASKFDFIGTTLAGFINNLVVAGCILSELFHVGDC